MDYVKKNSKFVKIGIILLFVIIAVIVSKYHEPWSDEAQSFLIARDNSIQEICYYAKYEGTSPLWFIIIKIFILCGLKYNSFFIISIFFSVLGLIIFEFKVKAPWYIKLLLPFTYFILYQYTIIVRSYCMVFPVLMLIASIYPKRKEKTFLYCFYLLLLMNICSYTLLIAGSLVLIYLIELLKNKEINKKTIIPLTIMLCELFISFLILLPAEDCSFTPSNRRNIFSIIYQATIGSQKRAYINEISITILLVIYLFIAILKDKKYKEKIIQIFIIFIPIILENIFITSQIWHIGIITILMFTIFIITDIINDNAMIQIFLTIVCCVQIIWSLASINYDINNTYCASKEVAKFLTEIEYEKIYGFGFDVVAINPYFDYNIFENQNTKKSFWIWKKDNGYVQDETILDIDNSNSIYIISDFYINEYKSIYNNLISKGYKEYHFTGEMFTKLYKNEAKGYYILVKE